MGSRVSRSTSRTSIQKRQHVLVDLVNLDLDTPRSVISAKVKLALRCSSTFSEYTKVLKDRKGSPVKKSVSARFGCGQTRSCSWSHRYSRSLGIEASLLLPHAHYQRALTRMVPLSVGLGLVSQL